MKSIRMRVILSLIFLGVLINFFDDRIIHYLHFLNDVEPAVLMITHNTIVYLILSLLVLGLFWENKVHKKLRESEERYRTIVTISPKIILVSRENKIIYANPWAINLLGAATESEVLGCSIFDVLLPTNHKLAQSRLKAVKKRPQTRFERYEVVTFNKTITNIELKSVSIMYNGKPAFLHVGRDITDRLKMEKKIQHMALHDPLTNLPNRRSFEISLKQTLTEIQEDRKIAVMFIDVDNFKHVNDTLGHEAGDQLLKQMTERFTACKRENDILARLSGDEFVLLLPSVNEVDTTVVAERIIESLSKPITIEQSDFKVTASIGIAFYPNDGNDSKSLLKKADYAMYQAKKKGKNNYHLYKENETIQ